MFPWQQANTAPKFALLLTSLDDGINIDRAALRQAGVTRLHSLDSGERALDIIRGQAGEKPDLAVDFVICTGDLSDMGLSDFLRRLEADCSGFPIMVISGKKDEVPMALSQGAAAALGRPYSMNELTRAVEIMRSRPVPLTVTQQNAPNIFTAAAGAPRARVIPSTQDTSRLSAEPVAQPPLVESVAHPTSGYSKKVAPAAQEYVGSVPNKVLWTRKGLSLLKQGQPEAARKFLTGALDYDPLDIEAAMALSRLYQQDEDDERSHRWLHRAAVICLNTRQYERAEMLFSLLPEKWQGDHEMIEAQELLLEGNYDAACEAFINICTSRKDVMLHRLLGRACQFTHSPEDCIYELLSAMERNGYESTARMLETRLLGGRDSENLEAAGLLVNFPRLQEVVAVARFTAQAFRAI